MSVAAVRDLRAHQRLDGPGQIAAFEQDLLAEFVLARSDATIRADVAAVEAAVITLSHGPKPGRWPS